MKFGAPEYSDDDSHGGDGEQYRKMAAAGDDCPSQLSDERTELLELQWRDGHPVEQPVHNLDRSNDTAGQHVDACAPGEKKKKNKAAAAAAGGGPNNKADQAATLAVEPVEEWWKLWREGENYGGSSSAAAYGCPIIMQQPQVDANSSSVNAKKQVHDDSTADELWRLWREGHGSSAPQDSTCKTTNSVLKGESLLPSSAASGGSGAQRHSSEQIEEQCSTLDQAIEYMKSLQQQIQVLSSGGYAMQPLLFPCICSQAPHPAAVPAAAAAAPLHPVPCALPQPPQPSLAAPLYQALPPPIPAADHLMNPVMVPIGGPAGGASGMIDMMSAGLADKMP